MDHSTSLAYSFLTIWHCNWNCVVPPSTKPSICWSWPIIWKKQSQVQSGTVLWLTPKHQTRSCQNIFVTGLKQLRHVIIQLQKGAFCGFENMPKCVFGGASASEPPGGALNTPPSPQVVWGGDIPPKTTTKFSAQLSHVWFERALFPNPYPNPNRNHNSDMTKKLCSSLYSTEMECYSQGKKLLFNHPLGT